MKPLLTLGGALLCGSLAATAFAEPIPTSRVRDSATRAIRVLEQSIRVWHQKRTCYSCHHQGLAILLVAEARTRAVSVDETLARQNISVGLQGLKSLDRAIQSVELIDPAGDTGSELVAASAAGIPRGIAREVSAVMIAKRQRSDGGWHTLDNRPPQAWSRVSATAVAIQAIQAYGPAARKDDGEARIRRARQWLLSVRPRDTVDRAYQIFGAIAAGSPQSELETMKAALVAEQRSDGGWGQLTSRPSDAYATGEALVALFEAGMAPSETRFQRGIAYLLGTQAADGSWHVATRMHEQDLVSPPHFETGFPHGPDQMISAMGTSWAVRALLRALPQPRNLPGPLIDAAEWQAKDEAAWMRTALFGTGAELEGLLAGGLDPNSRTAAGTTLLMMAGGDRSKVEALVRRGADVNLAAKTGFTPLIVAANDPEGGPAVKLLLERGAAATPTNPKPLHDGSPMFFAVASGNADAVRLLVQHGAEAAVRMRVGGLFTAGALEMAVIQNDVPMVQALVAAGVDVNTLNDSGLPALSSAVMANRLEAAKALIALGANVNVVDELSLTPLMHAALVDYGDTEMVELLLASGASVSPRSKDNHTALDLARQHSHTAIARLLEGPRAGN